MDCSKQPSWELGLLCYELACIQLPKTLDFNSTPLAFDFQLLENLNFPKQFTEMVTKLLCSDPTNRLGLREALNILEDMC